MTSIVAGGEAFISEGEQIINYHSFVKIRIIQFTKIVNQFNKYVYVCVCVSLVSSLFNQAIFVSELNQGMKQIVYAIKPSPTHEFCSKGIMPKLSDWIEMNLS